MKENSGSGGECDKGGEGKESMCECKNEGMGHYTIKDVPVSDPAKDLLGSLKYVKSLATYIQKCDTPMTIAIQGDWGSGKTSIMRMIQCDFDRVNSGKKEYPNIHTVWFNTWQFSQFGSGEDLPLNFLNCLVDSVKKIDNGGKADSEAENKISRSMAVLNACKLSNALIGDMLPQYISKAVNAGIEIAATCIDEEKNSKAGDKEKSSISDVIRTLKDDLQDWVNNKLNIDKNDEDKNNGRIVIFVDDLDRVEPSKAIEFIEILKLFMDLKHCIYVLAVDTEIVIRGVREKFGRDLNDEKARAYFEKIIQLTFKIPVAEYDVEGYIHAFLKKMLHKESVDKNITAFVLETIGRNPRKLKRLFASFTLQQIIKEQNSGQDKDTDLGETLLVLTCIQLGAEPFYNLMNYAKENKKFSELLEAGEDTFEALHDDRFFHKAFGRFDINEDDWERYRRILKGYNKLVNKNPNITREEKIGQFEKAVVISDTTAGSAVYKDSGAKNARRQDTVFDPDPIKLDASIPMKEIREINDGIGLDSCMFISFGFEGDETDTKVLNGNDLIQKALGKIFAHDKDKFRHLVQNASDRGLQSLFRGTGSPREIKQKGFVDGTDIPIEMKNGAGRKIELINQVMTSMGMDPADFTYTVKIKRYKNHAAG